MNEAPLEHQYLGFTVGGERFCVPLLRVQGIALIDAIHKTPGQPALLRGFVERDGVSVPVVDLAVSLGFGRASSGRRSCVVLADLAGGDGSIGLWVDEVCRIYDLPEFNSADLPQLGMNHTGNYLCHTDRHVVRDTFVLNTEHILTAEEMRLINQWRPTLERPPCH